MSTNTLPSRFQHGDFVVVSFADAGMIKNCQVDGILFDIGKIYYNLTVKMTIDGKNYFTNLLSIDSAFVSKDETPLSDYQPEIRTK